ncbi:MAG TPA: hypothetical protein VHF69_11480 [Candidatus Synoicihabitans sp.]|nr:hypothetical protein [Candidatus Synoicihabitans sp.]
MKVTAAKTQARPRTVDARTADILTALKDARKSAVRSAKMHQVPVVYLRGGTIVRERA